MSFGLAEWGGKVNSRMKGNSEGYCLLSRRFYFFRPTKQQYVIFQINRHFCQIQMQLLVVKNKVSYLTCLSNSTTADVKDVSSVSTIVSSTFRKRKCQQLMDTAGVSKSTFFTLYNALHCFTVKKTLIIHLSFFLIA